MPSPAGRGATLREGQRVDRFRIGWLVGIGATSEIYVASDERQRRDIVLKLITHSSPARSHLLRLQREIAALESARHPNVLRVYECGQVGERAYLITEFADGGSLEDRLREARPTTAQSVELLRGIAAGLDCLHDLAIVHGDVKPANVLLTRNVQPLLADFGVARLPSETAPLQASGTPVGTPLYMSPEQIRNEPLQQASDVYSFAVLAYQLLSGRVPFMAEISADVMHMHLTAVPPPVANALPGLPPALDVVLRRGMAKDPASRWERCSDMVTAVVACLDAAALAEPAAATPPVEERPQSVASRLVARLFPPPKALAPPN